MPILPRNIQVLACCAGACLQSSFCTWENFNRRKWGNFNRRKLGNIQPALTIRYLFNRVCPLQRLAEEESQGCRTMADGADTKLPFVEQVHLIGADLFRPKLIRRTAEMFCERRHNPQVAVHGSLRVITTLEFFQHLLAKLGHRDLLVTHKIPPPSHRCHYHTVATTFNHA